MLRTRGRGAGGAVAAKCRELMGCGGSSEQGRVYGGISPAGI